MVDRMPVFVHRSGAALGRAAADTAADALRRAVSARGLAHAMFATGNSQLAFVDALVHGTPDVPWADVVVFHMDEYVGIGPDHGAGFQHWIRTRIVDEVRPRAAHYLDGLTDPAAECDRYSRAPAHPSPRPVLSRHRRERPSGVQRSACGRLRRSPGREARRARGRLSAAAGERRSLSFGRRRAHRGGDGDDPGAPRGHDRPRHRARGPQGRTRPRRARWARCRRRARRRCCAPSPRSHSISTGARRALSGGSDRRSRPGSVATFSSSVRSGSRWRHVRAHRCRRRRRPSWWRPAKTTPAWWRARERRRCRGRGWPIPS